MTSHRLAVTLTALDLVLLLGVMAQDRVAQAKSPLGGESNSYTQILSRGANPFVKIVDADGKEHVIKP